MAVLPRVSQTLFAVRCTIIAFSGGFLASKWSIMTLSSRGGQVEASRLSGHTCKGGKNMGIITLVVLLFVAPAAFGACDPADLEENVRWCTVNARLDVKAAFCRELAEDNVGQAFSSFNDCERHEHDHDKTMMNAQECSLNSQVPTVLDLVRKHRANLPCD
jgi:hypothetical protein